MQSIECRLNTRVKAAKTKYRVIGLDMKYEDQQLVSRELERAEQGESNSHKLAAVLTAEIILNRYK